MSVPSSTQSSTATPAVVLPAPSAAEIDASCRIPVLHFFLAALSWLVVGTILGFISSIKMHGSFLDQTPWLTYGRVWPAAMNAILFGFATQAGLGVVVWLIARLGRNPVSGVILPTFAGVLWNLGVATGVVGILAGMSTGYPWLEAPLAAGILLIVAYALTGIWALIAFQQRQTSELYVSQWYILAALLWFPWLYVTAELLLVVSPVRGVMQSVVNWWFINGFTQLWLGGVGLATLFYFIPKLLKRPLHSGSMAAIGFWFLALLGGFGGVPVGSPVPKWIPSLSVVTTVALIVPLLAVVINLFQTAKAGTAARADDALALKFVLLGAASYGVSMLGHIFEATRSLGGATRLTVFGSGISHLFVLGFFGLTVLGAIHYIVPKLVERDWARPGLSRIHFWLSVIGIFMTAAGLLAGGFVQGGLIRDPNVSAVDAARKIVPFLGIATLGWALLALGSLVVLTNLKLTLFQFCLSRFNFRHLLAPLNDNPGGKS